MCTFAHISWRFFLNAITMHIKLKPGLRTVSKSDQDSHLRQKLQTTSHTEKEDIATVRTNFFCKRILIENGQMPCEFLKAQRQLEFSVLLPVKVITARFNP